MNTEDEENCDGFLSSANLATNKNVNESLVYTNSSRSEEVSDSVTYSNILLNNASDDPDLTTENIFTIESELFGTTESPYDTTEDAELHSQHLQPVDTTHINSCKQ